MSLTYMGFESLSALPRLFMAPLLVLFIWYLIQDNPNNTFKILFRVYVFVIVLGALSFFYQFLFGQVSWFAEAGAPRGGVFRYSSLLGSLTIYGTSVQYALLFVLVFNKNSFLKHCVIVILLLGGVASMQKASIMNIVLVYIVYYMMFNKIGIVYQLRNFLILLLMVAIAWKFISATIIGEYINSALSNVVGFNVFDNSNASIDSRIDLDEFEHRFYGQASEIISQNNSAFLSFFGIGIEGGGGGMGVEATQAHNTLWDLLLMGGIGYLITFLLMYLRAFLKLLKSRNTIDKFLLASLILFFINLPLSSALIFHPITSFPFWFAIAFTIKSHVKKVPTFKADNRLVPD